MVTCPTCRSDNQDGARFCSNCGSPLGGPRPVEGERKFATVLFADVVRSTAMGEQLDPEDLAAVMNGAFAFMNAAITRYGGTVSRLMGDAVLALFGAPVAHEDDAERAVRAALDIQQAAAAYGRTVSARYGTDFTIRVGINTGTAVLATVGDAVKAEYTAMGDAANVAARLQTAASPGTVLISATTQRLVKAQFELEPHGELLAKGKSAPIETYQVLSAKVVPGKVRGLEGLSSPLVGRDAELAVLRSKLTALHAPSGTGAVFAILGEAGLGKSRLVAELKSERTEGVAADVAWYEGRAISYGQSNPYFPWQQLGGQMIGAEPGQSGDALHERLRAYATRQAIPAKDLPFLETMLGVETEASRTALSGLDGDALVYGVATAVVGCIRSAMRSGERPLPHVLVFDDLHWADNASLELIAQVATLAADDPLLLVCVLRPDRKAASWSLLDRLRSSGGSAYVQLDLQPLPPTHARELLGNLLHVEDLPEEVRALILQRSDGNPFYLEEVLRSLIDSGHIVQENGHWRANSGIDTDTIPETLAGVLASRIDRLPEHTKRVAQTAAVLGRIFAYRALTKVCRDAPVAERIEHVDPHLGMLSFEDLVRERARDPEREYIFKHALTCEAAYDLLLRSRRRELHARVGAALEEIHRERTDEIAPILAHHFEEAGDGLRTAKYSMRSAERALRVYALKEALAHYERACASLESLPEPPPNELYDAIMGWAIARHKADEYQGVPDRMEKAIAIARELGDKRKQAKALTWMANVQMLRGSPSQAPPYLMEAQQLANEVGDERLVLLPLFFASEAMIDRDPRGAVAQFEQVIATARKTGVRELEAHSMASRAHALARLGEFAAAEAGIEEAIEAAPRSGSVVKEADVNIVAGIVYRELGNLGKSLEHARKGAELAESVNAIDCACSGNLELGLTQLARKELEEALDRLHASLDFADRSLEMGPGIEGFVNRIRGGVAAAKIELSDPHGLGALETALQNARSDHDEYGDAVISEQLARVSLRLGEAEKADQLLKGPLEYYRRTLMKPYLSRALTLAADVQDHLGLAAAAQSARAEAATLEQSFRVAAT
jgi:class 3 adenylate cyclase/tetratricopeptide (TPR) repeat protein